MNYSFDRFTTIFFFFSQTLYFLIPKNSHASQLAFIYNLLNRLFFDPLTKNFQWLQKQTTRNLHALNQQSSVVTEIDSISHEEPNIVTAISQQSLEGAIPEEAFDYEENAEELATKAKKKKKRKDKKQPLDGEPITEHEAALVGEEVTLSDEKVDISVIPAPPVEKEGETPAGDLAQAGKKRRKKKKRQKKKKDTKSATSSSTEESGRTSGASIDIMESFTVEIAESEQKQPETIVKFEDTVELMPRAETPQTMAAKKRKNKKKKKQKDGKFVEEDALEEAEVVTLGAAAAPEITEQVDYEEEIIEHIPKTEISEEFVEGPEESPESKLWDEIERTFVNPENDNESVPVAALLSETKKRKKRRKRRKVPPELLELGSEKPLEMSSSTEEGSLLGDLEPEIEVPKFEAPSADDKGKKKRRRKKKRKPQELGTGQAAEAEHEEDMIESDTTEGGQFSSEHEILVDSEAKKIDQLEEISAAEAEKIEEINKFEEVLAPLRETIEEISKSEEISPPHEEKMEEMHRFEETLEPAQEKPTEVSAEAITKKKRKHKKKKRKGATQESPEEGEIIESDYEIKEEGIQEGGEFQKLPETETIGITLSEHQEPTKVEDFFVQEEKMAAVAEVVVECSNKVDEILAGGSEVYANEAELEETKKRRKKKKNKKEIVACMEGPIEESDSESMETASEAEASHASDEKQNVEISLVEEETKSKRRRKKKRVNRDEIAGPVHDEGYFEEIKTGSAEFKPPPVETKRKLKRKADEEEPKEKPQETLQGPAKLRYDEIDEIRRKLEAITLQMDRLNGQKLVEGDRDLVEVRHIANARIPIR